MLPGGFEAEPWWMAHTQLSRSPAPTPWKGRGLPPARASCFLAAANASLLCPSLAPAPAYRRAKPEGSPSSPGILQVVRSAMGVRPSQSGTLGGVQCRAAVKGNTPRGGRLSCWSSWPLGLGRVGLAAADKPSPVLGLTVCGDASAREREEWVGRGCAGCGHSVPCSFRGPPGAGWRLVL